LLAKKYRVLKWLKAAYIRLLQQPIFTMEELTRDPKLDWETIGRLFSVKVGTSVGVRFCSLLVETMS